MCAVDCGKSVVLPCGNYGDDGVHVVTMMINFMLNKSVSAVNLLGTPSRLQSFSEERSDEDQLA